MNIEIATICDAATANGAGGRLNILGAFDRIFANFPLVIPQCSTAFRIRYARSEAGLTTLRSYLKMCAASPLCRPCSPRFPWNRWHRALTLRR